MTKNLRRALDEIILEHGPWTAHNIQLASGIYTMGSDGFDRAQKRSHLYYKLYRNLKGPTRFRGLKVLDLGCLEGGISLYFAKQGAVCTGIDVRTSHLVKARFAANVLGVGKRCNWLEGDVTDQTIWKRLGKYDLVICSGLLYHIAACDIIPLLKNLKASSKQNGLTILDSNISFQPTDKFSVDNNLTLHGNTWIEHNKSASIEERMAANWSSMMNDDAFWLTERSLANALVYSGYGTVIKSLYPYHEWAHQMRDIWIAFGDNPDIAKYPYRNDPDLRPIEHPGLK